MTIDQFNEIVKSHNLYLSPSDYSKYATMSPSDFGDAVKNTTTQLQTNTMETAQKYLEGLQLPAAYRDYAQSNIGAVGGYQQMREASPEYQDYRDASRARQEMIQKGPMYELSMRQDLARISPTFMGASREQLRTKLAEMEPNPVIREKMIDDYMGYADSAMRMSLSTLGQLRDSAMIAAQYYEEDKKSQWEKVASVYDEAFSATLMANKDLLNERLGAESGVGIGGDFTNQQKQKLEQAGLQNASRQEQLDFLYGDTEDEEITTISPGQILTATRTMKQADVENLLKATYTQEQLARMAKDAGFGRWHQTSAKEVTKYLESPSAREAVAKILEEQYRESGYTIEGDAEKTGEQERTVYGFPYPKR